jgi:hypothetical protein
VAVCGEAVTTVLSYIAFQLVAPYVLALVIPVAAGYFICGMVMT